MQLHWLLILFRTSDSTVCRDCLGSGCNYLKLDPTRVSPGTSRGERDRARLRMNVRHLFCWWLVFQLCGRSTAAARHGGRQRAAAVQLPASPECYKRNCLQRGNWHAHTHTWTCTHTHTHTKYSGLWLGTVQSVFCCCHMKALLQFLPVLHSQGIPALRMFEEIVQLGGLEAFWTTCEHVASCFS